MAVEADGPRSHQLSFSTRAPGSEPGSEPGTGSTDVQAKPQPEGQEDQRSVRRNVSVLRADPVAAEPWGTQSVLAVVLKSLWRTFLNQATVLRKILMHENVDLTLAQLLRGLMWLTLAFQLMLLALVRPKLKWLLVFLVQGVGLGLLTSLTYFKNKRRKEEQRQVLAASLGMKGMHFMLGGMPSWLSFTEREKVKWLNRTLEEVWPFYDKAVSKMLKDMVESIFEQQLKVHKVFGVRSIGFKQLAFGNAPLTVNSIHVTDRHGKEEAVVLEVDVSWCGEANICLAVELSLMEGTTLYPRVSDIRFAGQLRIVLQPLVDEIPGFGAALVTFRKPPTINYQLCFGKKHSGGFLTFVTKKLGPAIHNIIDNVVINMLVWPQRIVVPIINTEDMQYELEKLELHISGIMKITVNRARNLPVADVVGSSDPFVEITSDSKHFEKTKVITDNLNPEWNETFYLLIHEPERQHLRLSVFDHDTLNLAEALKLNFNQVVGAQELLGRSLVNVLPTTKCEGEYHTQWYNLGKGDWGRTGGCGSDRGQIELTTLYRSFSHIKPEEPIQASKGIIVIKVIHAHDLPMSRSPSLTAAVRVKCGKDREVVNGVESEGDHHWYNNNDLEFYNVQSSATVDFKVYDEKSDDELGRLLVPIVDIVHATDINRLTGVQEAGFVWRSFRLQSKRRCYLTVALRYVPYV